MRSRSRPFRGLAGLVLFGLLALGARSVLDAGTAVPQGTLEQVLSIGGVDADVLLMWVSLAVDDDGSLYVSDTLDYAIKVFDSSGKLLRKAGRSGEGPGEFKTLRDVAVSQERVFAADQFRLSISVFDKSLRYLTAIPVTAPISCLRAQPDGTIAVVRFVMAKGQKASLWLADAKGKTLADIAYGTDTESPTNDLAGLAFDGPDLILAYSFKDLVVRMDRHGRVIWARDLFHLGKAKTEVVSGFKMPAEYIYKDVTVDAAGRIYVLGGSPAAHPSREVYILDAEGRLTASLLLPDPTHCIVVDRQGFLYSRADDGCTIKKYRVKLPGEKAAATPGRQP